MSELNLTNLKQKSILNLLHFDISEFFNFNYKEIETLDTPAVMTVIYELELPKLEFDLFNSIRMRVMFDKLFVESENHINISLFSKKEIVSTKSGDMLIYKVYELLGKDLKNNIIKQNQTISKNFHATWISDIGESFIQIKRNEHLETELHILFANNLLKQNNKKIVF